MMTMLAKTETRVLGIADYEARIQLYKEQAVTGYIGIGRTLNEAKAAGVVPHGEWEAWVERTTGLAIRQAQRCMKAATEIREGSFLGQIDMSKAMLLLSSGLEDEQREALAERAAKDDSSVRELKEEIRRLKLEKVQEAGANAEMRTALKKAESERDQLKDQLGATVQAVREDAERKATEAYERGTKDQASMDGMALAQANGVIDRYEKRVKELAREIRELQADAEKQAEEAFRRGKASLEEEVAKQHKELLETVHRRAMEADALRNELNGKSQYAEELRKELEAAEAREAKRARELAELKKERAKAGMDAARGIRADAMNGLDLTAAVRAFIGQAGVLPQMGQILAGMSESERAGIRAQVETVAEWVRASRGALGIVAADATIQ